MSLTDDHLRDKENRNPTGCTLAASAGEAGGELLSYALDRVRQAVRPATGVAQLEQ